MTFHDILRGLLRLREPGPRFGLAGGGESGYIWLPSDIPSVLRRPRPVRFREDPEP